MLFLELYKLPKDWTYLEYIQGICQPGTTEPCFSQSARSSWNFGQTLHNRKCLSWIMLEKDFKQYNNWCKKAQRVIEPSYDSHDVPLHSMVCSYTLFSLVPRPPGFSLVPRLASPGPDRSKAEKRGLVHTVCACIYYLSNFNCDDVVSDCNMIFPIL